MSTDRTKSVITYPEALQWLFALTLPPLCAPSPLPLGEGAEPPPFVSAQGGGSGGVVRAKKPKVQRFHRVKLLPVNHRCVT